jgi:hypothetical protein
VFFEQGEFPEGGLDEGLRGGSAVFDEEAFIEGADVDSDTDLDPGGGGGMGDFFDFVVEFVAAGRGELGDLLQHGVDIDGASGGHGLNRDRCVTADRHADHDLAGCPAPRGR